MCQKDRDSLAEFVGYWLDQMVDDDRPPSIVKTACELFWPGRTFRLVEGTEDDCDLYLLSDFEDEATGENAQDLLIAERPGDDPDEDDHMVEPEAVGDC
jgi:hypothetical protein